MSYDVTLAEKCNFKITCFKAMYNMFKFFSDSHSGAIAEHFAKIAHKVAKSKQSYHFVLILLYYSLSVLSVKFYFLGIGPVHQKLWSFKCTMLNFEFKFSRVRRHLI